MYVKGAAQKICFILFRPVAAIEIDKVPEMCYNNKKHSGGFIMTQNSHEYEYANLQKTPPLLAFDGSMTLDAWRKSALEKLRSALES